MNPIKIHQASRETNIVFARPQESFDLTIIDAKVARLYPELAKGAVLVPSGERSKSIYQFQRLQRELARRGLQRSSQVLAIGGGVVGDLVGFVCASYMRGIRYSTVPTTLLAMVDSSVGGKVAIDIPEGKNLVGAFWPPSSVWIDVNFLATLPKKHRRSGAAEIWKTAYIMKPDLLSPLRAEKIDEELVRKAIECKKEVVEADEFETKGIRATLNFGHTIAHALESELGYRHLLHGEAVAIGMVAESRIGETLGITRSGTADQIAHDLHRFGLPIDHPLLHEPERLLTAMRSDKKTLGKGLAFSFLESMGKCKLVTGVEPASVIRALSKT